MSSNLEIKCISNNNLEYIKNVKEVVVFKDKYLLYMYDGSILKYNRSYFRLEKYL